MSWLHVEAPVSVPAMSAANQRQKDASQMRTRKMLMTQWSVTDCSFQMQMQ